MIDLNVLKDEHAILEVQDGIAGKKVIYLHLDGVTQIRINVHEGAGFEVYDNRAKGKVKTEEDIRIDEEAIKIDQAYEQAR